MNRATGRVTGCLLLLRRQSRRLQVTYEVSRIASKNGVDDAAGDMWRGERGCRGLLSGIWCQRLQPTHTHALASAVQAHVSVRGIRSSSSSSSSSFPDSSPSLSHTITTQSAHQPLSRLKQDFILSILHSLTLAPIQCNVHRMRRQREPVIRGLLLLQTTGATVTAKSDCRADGMGAEAAMEGRRSTSQMRKDICAPAFRL